MIDISEQNEDLGKQNTVLSLISWPQVALYNKIIENK